MKTLVHVNQHIIKSNRTHGEKEAPLTVKTYKENRKGNEVIIYGVDGLPAARVVYSPDKPLDCGAHVWIETYNGVDVL